MTRRLVVITEIIAPYRIPVFNALAQHHDVDLHVIFLAETDPTRRQWPVYKDDIQFSCEVVPGFRRRVAGHNFLLNWGIENALRRAAPDAIVCGGYNYFASWSSLRWAERNQLPFYLWIESTGRDSRNRFRWIESLKANFLRRCQGFIVPGKSACQYLESHGIPRDVIFTAPNAVDTQFFAERSETIRKDRDFHRRQLGLPERFFLFVGRLVREKGVFDLLGAYASLNPEIRREIGLVLVGDGPARPTLVRGAGQLPGSVLLPGFAQRELLATYYALADAFVLPTHTDPWGLVVNEAMSCALPVICSDAAGCAPDLVQDSWNGRLVRAGDVNQLTGALNELAGDDELRRQMGWRSRERIARYSSQECAAGFVEAVLAREACAA